MNKLQQLFGDNLPKLVMFDLDGTLIDSVPELAIAVDKTLQELGKSKAGINKVKLWIGNGAKALISRAINDAFPADEISEDLQSRALDIFFKFYAEHSNAKLYPGVRETLKYLHKRKVKMALITNKPERFLSSLLDDLKISGYFQWVIGGDTLPQQKPDPTALNLVIKMAKVTPSESLFIGDSRNDVQAAHAANVRCIAVTYGYNYGVNIADENPDLIVDDLRELLPAQPKTTLRTKIRRFFH